jgi:CubicO group peptidase (beta-lactamase class C family)
MLMRYSARRSFRLALMLVAVCRCSIPALAGNSEKPPAATPAPAVEVAKPGNVSDAADLEAFFDGVIPVQMDTQHIAGAVVAVAAGDKVVFAKGYGYADVDGRRKVDPDKTMFPIASITKLFTWTAAMQLFEAGKLDLDADVNKYLKDLQVPAAFDRPITLKNLMTHTPGLDESVIGLFSRKAEDARRPLAQVLKEQLPLRVRPPGVIASYSNHGAALAGLVVADVSEMPWEDYVEQRILQPLGMRHTSVRQPPADQLPPDLSKGYRWVDGRFKAQAQSYAPMAPAGCISASAADMARFMLAHLHDGRLGDARILKPETARLMHSPLFRPDPKAGAMCYGFCQQECNDQRVIGHGGDWEGFQSLLQLLPERGAGLFVSYNVNDSYGVHSSDAARAILFNAFMRRYFPAGDPPRSPTSGDFAARASRLAGEYGTTGYSHTSCTKLAAALARVQVVVNDDGTITVSSWAGTTRVGPHRFVEVEPLVFRELDGQQKVVFQEDPAGNIAYVFFPDDPSRSVVRKRWYERYDVQVALLGGFMVVFGSALLFWPALAFTVRGGYSPEIKRNWRSGVLSCLAWLLSVASIGFVIGFALFLDDPNEVTFGLPRELRLLLAVTQVCAVLAALTVVGCLIAWKNRYWRLTGRLHYTLVAAAGVVFVAWLYQWNLLTFGFRDLL